MFVTNVTLFATLWLLYEWESTYSIT